MKGSLHIICIPPHTKSCIFEISTNNLLRCRPLLYILNGQATLTMSMLLVYGLGRGQWSDVQDLPSGEVME